MEQLDYNLLYRRFVGLGVDETVWGPNMFTRMSIAAIQEELQWGRVMNIDQGLRRTAERWGRRRGDK
jgi:hypothetical protein